MGCCPEASWPVAVASADAVAAVVVVVVVDCCCCWLLAAPVADGPDVQEDMIKKRKDAKQGGKRAG